MAPDGLNFLVLPTPFLSVSIGSLLPDLRMTRRKQQRVRVADFRPNQTKIARGIKKTRIPAFPVGQKLFDLTSEVHRPNVYEAAVQDNDEARGFGKGFALSGRRPK